MSESKSKIEWTDYTWNPWLGCRKTDSAGCHNCYMFRDMKRYGNNPQEIRKSKTKFDMPLKIKESGAKIFTCSWSDFFIEEADEWRDDAWGIIRQRQDLTFQMLTKRPHRIEDNLPKFWLDIRHSVWLGVSVCDYNDTDKWFTLNSLNAIPTTFISLEPLLCKMDMRDLFFAGRLPDWVIVGGESGSDRPMKQEWVENIVKDCKRDNIPVFVKQMGSWWAKQNGVKVPASNMDEWDESIRVREFPVEI